MSMSAPAGAGRLLHRPVDTGLGRGALCRRGAPVRHDVRLRRTPPAASLPSSIGRRTAR